MKYKPLKVAYFLGSLDRGGTETLLLDCFCSAAEAEFDFIGIHRKDGRLLNSFHETGVPFYHVSFRNRFDLGYFLRLRKTLISQSITIAHAQQPIDALLAWSATRGTGIKVVLTLHGYDFADSILPKWINHFVLRKTDMNLFVSKSLMNYFVNKYSLPDPGRLKVVYNGISFEKFSEPLLSSIREELGIKKDIMLICSVGNFVAGKDPITICRFLLLLKAITSDFRMIFAGARNANMPEMYDDCVAFCKENGLTDNVLFLGSRSDVPDILRQSDVFIYSSDHDTFGIAVIEAIASGIPVFVNDWEVMKEVTDGGKYATLYKTKDEHHLLELFLDYLSNRESYQEQAMNAALWARDNFSVKKHLVALNNAYCNLI